eukprot:scaffold212366_cov37-Tisochrysis_lutea.AAC.1
METCRLSAGVARFGKADGLGADTVSMHNKEQTYSTILVHPALWLLVARYPRHYFLVPRVQLLA